MVIVGTADKIREELDRMNADAVSPGMAAVAIELAKAFDETDAATSKAVTARELSAVMTRLRAIAPVQSEGDAVDDITRQREKRREAARQLAAGD